MSAHGGPNIVEDGLVLALDAANVKSFRGEPTINLINNPLNPLSGWNHNNMVITEADNGFFSANETTTNDSHIVRQSFTTQPSTIYTFSCFVKKLGRRYIALSFTSYPNWTGGQGGHTYFDLDTESIVSSLGTGPIAAGISRLPNTDIYFVFITAISSSSVGSAVNLFTYADSNFSTFSGDVNLGILFKHFQLEAKPYATPFVNGTRGATVATGGGWKDMTLSGNNGALTNSPTFDSDNLGSLVFDGVDDYITLSNPNWSSVFNNTIGNNFSLRCIIKPTNIGTHQALISQRHGDAMSLFLLANGKVTLEMDDTSNRVGTNTVLQNNNWYDITVTFENNTSQSRAYYYVNGQFERDELKWDGNGVSTNNNLWIGWQSRTNYDINPTYFNGEIAYVQIYNRALTAEEVLQNYNATKGRYGL
jgi:hypothetical protein